MKELRKNTDTSRCSERLEGREGDDESHAPAAHCGIPGEINHLRVSRQWLDAPLAAGQVCLVQGRASALPRHLMEKGCGSPGATAAPRQQGCGSEPLPSSRLRGNGEMLLLHEGAFGWARR